MLLKTLGTILLITFFGGLGLNLISPKLANWVAVPALLISGCAFLVALVWSFP